jgi:hypothetical protein
VHLQEALLSAALAVSGPDGGCGGEQRYCHDEVEQLAFADRGDDASESGENKEDRKQRAHYNHFPHPLTGRSDAG